MAGQPLMAYKGSVSRAHELCFVEIGGSRSLPCRSAFPRLITTESGLPEALC